MQPALPGKWGRLPSRHLHPSRQTQIILVLQQIQARGLIHPVKQQNLGKARRQHTARAGLRKGDAMENHEATGIILQRQGSEAKQDLASTAQPTPTPSLNAKTQPRGFRLPVQPNSCLHPAKTRVWGGRVTDGRWGRIHQTPLSVSEDVMGRGWVIEQGLSFFSALPFPQQDPWVPQ